MAQTEYVKLPGRGPRSKGLVSHSSFTLWVGPGHLLQIESHGGYTEDYKRFYFRDIQAITVRQTQTAAIWTTILAVTAGTFGLIAWSVREQPIAFAVLCSFASLAGVCLAVNAARGATSVCHLKTAVQLNELPSLRRLRTARKTLAILQPLIEQAQGSFNSEALQAHLETTAQTPPPLQPGPSFAGQRRLGPSPYKGRTHSWFFAVLLFSGLLDIGHIFYHPVGFMAFEMILSAGLVGLAVVALVKQQGTDLDSATQTVTWISAIYLGILVAASYFEMMAMSITEPGAAVDQWTVLKRFAEMEPFETTWLLVSLVINIFVASGLGALGWLSSRKRRFEKPPVAPPPAITGQPTP